eukprot:6139933-Amphidinium_carterae.1
MAFGEVRGSEGSVFPVSEKNQALLGRFTSQWQTGLYDKHPELTQTKMMLMGNLFGTFITLASIASSWSAV